MQVRLALLAWLLAINVGVAQERPNVLLVMLDDLGYSDLGCYGAPVIQTPTIDRLAKQGVRFSQFYSTSQCHS